MAERKRSTDGRQETREILGDDPIEAPSHAGRAGGTPAKQVATTDEEKQALKDPAGKTRVTKSLEDDERDK